MTDMGEEEHFFPALNKLPGMEGLMDINIEQHKAFHPGLEKLDKYVSETKPEDYDGKVLKEIIKLRKQDKAERDEHETLLDVYMRAMETASPEPVAEAA